MKKHGKKRSLQFCLVIAKTFTSNQNNVPQVEKNGWKVVKNVKNAEERKRRDKDEKEANGGDNKNMRETTAANRITLKD